MHRGCHCDSRSVPAYAATTGTATDWYRHLQKTPAVTVRMGELAMKAVAAPIEDLTEVARVHELFRQKYLRARIAEWTGSEVGHGRVVQLTELNQLP